MNTLSLFDSLSNDATLSDVVPVLAQTLKQGLPITHKALAQAMTEALGGTDAEGVWDWGQAHDAAEAALALHITRRGRGLLSSQASTSALINRLDILEQQLPTRTRRSDETQTLQQFSTPLPLALIAIQAASLKPSYTLLEPSAGTGLIASLAFKRCASMALNELSNTRADLLKAVFGTAEISRIDAESIDDTLPDSIQPTVVVMNPPFTHTVNSEFKSQRTTYRHIKSALARLQHGGRLVAITLETFKPSTARWAKMFEDLQSDASLVFSVGIDGRVFAKHGTGIAVRLHVFDKGQTTKTNPVVTDQTTDSLSTLADLVANSLPARRTIAKSASNQPLRPVVPFAQICTPKTVKKAKTPVFDKTRYGEIIPLPYTRKTWQPANITDGSTIYEPYEPQLMSFTGAKSHPADLVQSTAMASVTPPPPTAAPLVPRRLIEGGLASAAQLEITLYAEQAHAQFIDGQYIFDEKLETLRVAREGEIAAPIRKGVFIGDGAGVGKGREVCSIILSNFLAGRKKAVWISDNAPLLEDAQRDWCALGGNKHDVLHLNKFKTSEAIDAESGILFLTYATLRAKARCGGQSRLDQITAWLGCDFDGVIVFDEAHAMANAAGSATKRGVSKASQQGQTGLKLQRVTPSSRIVYSSATGSTEVTNLAYAERLGLWLDNEFPFTSREDFIEKMQEGGVAALEVVARDLKALGLYFARSLSFVGVDVELTTHTLTKDQIDIYNKYADGWRVIHNNLESALYATKVSDPEKTYNSRAKSAARSALESNKQRFFNHLLTAMKMPTLIKCIKKDLEQGRSPVVQLVSTGEALLSRRLKTVPVSEWDNLTIDVTPREYIMDYLINSFPVQAFEIFTNEDGEEQSRPMYDENNNIVFCAEALRQRDALIEQLSTLPPIQSALDQLIFEFGTDQVSEVTGRSLRLVKTEDCIKVSKRPANSNLAETASFQDGRKKILIFSRAGGTGRSCHADADCKNQGQRVHYVAEAGWIAANAIQGLGRTNRSNQTSKPIVRPLTTNVRGERRFISTICKRLDTLGALTKGQRETGGQGLYSEADNLESVYAHAALSTFYQALYNGKLDACSIGDFEDMTGLTLRNRDSGTLLEHLPPLNRFLNRLLALRIDVQDSLFDAFEGFLNFQIMRAKEDGSFESGVETLFGDSFVIENTQEIFTHPCGTNTYAHKVRRTTKIVPRTLSEVLRFADAQTILVKNTVSNSYGTLQPTYSLTDEMGAPIQFYELTRPHKQDTLSQYAYDKSQWSPVTLAEFEAGWTAEVETRKTMTDQFWLVTGLLLPIWDKLGSRGKIWRLQSDCGQRLLGRYMTNKEMLGLQSRLSLNLDTKLTAGEVLEYIMEHNCSAKLGYNLQLKRSLVAGNYRLEVLGASYEIMQRIKSLGARTEYHEYKMRCYVPNSKEGETILNRLLAFAKLQSIL